MDVLIDVSATGRWGYAPAVHPEGGQPMGACNGFRYYELRHDWTYHTGPRQRIRLRECRSGVEWHGVRGSEQGGVRA